LVGDALQEPRVHAVFLGESVRHFIVAVPTGNTQNLSAQNFLKADGSVLRHVAKTLQRDAAFGRVQTQVLHRLAHGIDDAKASGFGASERTAAANRFAGNHAGGVLPGDARILVHHPTHHLGGGADVRSGDILAGTNVFVHGADVSPAQAFFFTD